MVIQRVKLAMLRVERRGRRVIQGKKVAPFARMKIADGSRHPGRQAPDQILEDLPPRSPGREADVVVVKGCAHKMRTDMERPHIQELGQHVITLRIEAMLRTRLLRFRRGQCVLLCLRAAGRSGKQSRSPTHSAGPMMESTLLGKNHARRLSPRSPSKGKPKLLRTASLQGRSRRCFCGVEVRLFQV